MLDNLKVIIPQWEHLDFSVNDEGMVVVSIVGDFPDPKNLSALEIHELVNDPWFGATLREAYNLATGALLVAFDHMQNGHRQMVVEFANIATVH